MDGERLKLLAAAYSYLYEFGVIPDLSTFAEGELDKEDSMYKRALQVQEFAGMNNLDLPELAWEIMEEINKE